MFALVLGDARAQTGGTHAFAGEGAAGNLLDAHEDASVGLGPYFVDADQASPLGGPLWEPGLHEPGAGWSGRWERELARREGLLKSHTGKDHRAALALLGLLPALGGEIERERLVSLVEGVSGDERRHPLVRGLAVDMRAQLHEDAGEFTEARGLYEAQGRLLSWQIVGPFDNANRGGHDQSYGPEREPYSADAGFEGKQSDERLEWRPYGRESTLRGGYVSFDEFLRPNEYVTGYATTWVHVDTEAKGGKSRSRAKAKGVDAVMHMGTGGAHKVWVNGELVGEGQAYRQPNPIQEAYALHLEPGWNRILVKIGCEAGAWGFFAQLRGTRGETLTGLNVSATPADSDALPPAALAAPAEQEPDAVALATASADALSLRALFEAAADETQTRRPRAEDELALAEFYSWTGPFSSEDFTERDQARTADAALESPRSAMFLGHAEDDSARARAAYETGIARALALRDANPDAGGASYPRAEHAQMLIDLAYANISLGLERRALELLEQARVVAPDDALIELAHVDQLAGDGFELAALDWLADLADRYPMSASISRERANRELGLGRVRAGLALLEAYSADHGGDISVIEQRIDVHLRLGEVSPAVALAREIIAVAPDRPISWQRLAQLEEAAGDYAEAVAALETAVGLAPSDPALHTSLGLLYSRAGDQGGSVMAFSRSLELNPQQPELRDLLATLGAEADDVFTRYAVELEEVVAASEAEPTPASWDGREAAVLHHMVATRIGSSGLGERLDHRMIKILDERGIESQSRHDFAYEPSESYVEVRRARVYRSDGRVEDIGVPRHYMVGSAGYRMYYDQRAVAVTFPSLRVGDVVEVAFVKRDVATRNMFDDYYGDIVPLQTVAPIRHFEYLLEAPADMTLHFNQSVAQAVPAATAGESGAQASGTAQTVSYQFVRDNIPGMRTEGGMPGWTDVADYLHVSTYATWDEVGRWYWGLVEGQLLVDDAIRAGVREAIAELPKDATRRDQVAALYRHVIDETRYVGLEFGIHGYKPYRTTDIYNRRFGDCKDKASLLKVMLGEIGVPSHLVLVRTRDLGSIAEAPASLSAFNHAIVYVPEFDLFMDGTAEHSGAFELPAGDQGASVVVIEDGQGASFRTIPYATADQNHSEYAVDIRLATDGSAEVHHEMDLVGTGAAPWRAGFEAEEQREDRLTKQLAQTFPGLEVRRASFPGIDDVLAPVRVEADLSVPGWAQLREQGGLRWRVIGQEVQLLRGIAPQPSREQPLMLGVPSRERRVLRYELPRGLTLSVSPEPRTVESDFGRFVLEVTTEASAATVTMTLEFSRARIEPGEYEAFREHLRAIDGALAQAFEAVPAR